VSLADLAGTAIQAADATVSLESIDVEQRYVETSPGVRSLQPCLVVRLAYPAGQVFWAQPDGVLAPGVEHRFFPSIGQYTGLFWPVSLERAQAQLRGVGIISLDTLKRDAVNRGYTLQLDNIPSPQPGDVRPSPSQAFP
jgi:hypothetical protein